MSPCRGRETLGQPAECAALRRECDRAAGRQGQSGAPVSKFSGRLGNQEDLSPPMRGKEEGKRSATIPSEEVSFSCVRSHSEFPQPFPRSPREEKEEERKEGRKGMDPFSKGLQGIGTRSRDEIESS